MSCLVGVLGRFWSFVKNFFEGYTSPPPRSAFAPPAPLCNEPGYLVYLRNLLCVNLLQYRNTCFCVATSVKISVFGVIFGGVVLCIYYANEFSILPLFVLFRPFSFRLFCPFSYLILFCFCFVLLPLIRAICPIVFCAYCQPGRGGVTFDSLVNVPR